jgi:hypothetical protein
MTNKSSKSLEIIKEAFIVGIVTALIGFIIGTALMFTNKNFTLKKYYFWKRVLFSYFIVGVILQLGFEAFGVNKWYCKNGVACRTN